MKIKFVPQDCWIGLYWKTEKVCLNAVYSKVFMKEKPRYFIKRIYYLCIIPCFPIIFTSHTK